MNRLVVLIVLGEITDGCKSDGNSFKCRKDVFGKQFSIEVKVVTCRNIKVSLKAAGITFDKNIDVDQDIPIPGFSYKDDGVMLNVNFIDLDNGDLDVVVSWFIIIYYACFF